MFNPITWLKQYLLNYNHRALAAKPNRTPQEQQLLERWNRTNNESN